jgi:hypothetical protein
MRQTNIGKMLKHDAAYAEQASFCRRRDNLQCDAQLITFEAKTPMVEVRDFHTSSQSFPSLVLSAAGNSSKMVRS